MECSVLNSCVFDDFISFDEPFAKAFEDLQLFLLVNNRLYGKFLSLPTMSDDNLTVMSLAFVEDFNLLSWEYDNLTFTV